MKEYGKKLEDLAGHIYALAAAHPGWKLEANMLRNFLIVDETGNSVGYIDAHNGELAIYSEEHDL